MERPDPSTSDASDPSAALALGRAAAGRGEWRAALDSFAAAAAAGGEDHPASGEAWEGIGLAAYWLEDAPRAIEAHEKAFSIYRKTGRPGAAARMALWLADDHLSFMSAGSVANGWIERAETLLEDVPEAPERAWLPVYRGHHALQVDHDAERALALADEALERARSLEVPQAELVALALQGLALVVRGDVEVGMPRLDEASAAAAAREVEDLNAVAWAFCYLIQGCDTVRDFSRATEWCERVMAFCERWDLGPIFTSCRTRYASVLTWQGRWRSAEEQIEKMLDSRGEVGHPPASARSATIRLAEVRRRQGRVDEAEALFRRAGEHRAAILGRAAVALARDEPEIAADLAERVLRLLPPTARAERTDALLLSVLAAASAGDPERAAEHLRELSETADRLGTEPLRAAAAHARGAVAAARGDRSDALAAFEDALAHYDRGGAPLEAAQVRLEAARLLAALDREETARREAAQARDEFERLGAAGDLERAEEFLRGEAPGPGDAGAAPAFPLTDRELEVLRLVSRGMSNAEIAAELYLSPHTVKRHVSNILRKLDCSSRAAAVAAAGRAGAL